MCPDTNACYFATGHVNYLYIVFGQYLLRYSPLSGTASSYSVDDGGIQCGSLSCILSTSKCGGLVQLAFLCSLKALPSSVFPSKLTSTGMSPHTCCTCPQPLLPPSRPPSFTHHEHPPMFMEDSWRSGICSPGSPAPKVRKCGMAGGGRYLHQSW